MQLPVRKSVLLPLPWNDASFMELNPADGGFLHGSLVSLVGVWPPLSHVTQVQF